MMFQIEQSEDLEHQEKNLRFFDDKNDAKSRVKRRFGTSGEKS